MDYNSGLTINEMLFGAGELENFTAALAARDRARMTASLIRADVPETEAEKIVDIELERE